MHSFLCPSNIPFREGNGNLLQYSCLENPMDGGAWWAAVLGVAKSWARLSDFIFTFHFHALEKEMATHSNILVWRIPGKEEHSELPSMGSHRVRHDWSDLAAAAAATFHCAHVPQLLYPFICRCTFRLLSCSSYCKQGCNDQWDTCVFFFLVLVSSEYMPRSGIAGS